jgi:hypothetical protein
MKTNTKILIGIGIGLGVVATVYIIRKKGLKNNISTDDVNKQSAPIVSSVTKKEKEDNSNPFYKNGEFYYPYLVADIETSLRKIYGKSTENPDFNVAKALDLMNESIERQIILSKDLKETISLKKDKSIDSLPLEERKKIYKMELQLIDLAFNKNNVRTKIEKGEAKLI